MTFDTFDTYNTDEAYKDKGTTAKGLVAAYKKDNPEGSKDDFYSKLNATWKEDKNGYVKAAVDEAFKETPKAEEKKETVIETPKKEEVTEKVTETAPKTDDKIKTSSLGGGEEQYYNDQKKRIAKAEGDALNKIDELSDYNWKKEFDTTSAMSEAYKRIDDKLVEQLPTFLLKRYTNGEFGDPKSSDAKLRFAHFMLNGVQSKLKNASNAAAIAAGRSPMFADTTSDYEKYQQSNLAKGMENRWKKYEAETQAAIDLATKEGMKEQEARLAVEQLTRDKQVNTVWNMMDSNQKLYAMEVTKKIGDYLGKMDISELGDFIAGAAYEGTMDKDKVVAIGLAKVIEKTPELIDKIKDEGMKNAVLSLIGGGTSIAAGVGGSADSNGNKTNLTGNIQNYKGIDGNEISFDFRDPKAKDKIDGEILKLKEKYANGEIDAETFKAYYDPLYAEGKKHLTSFTTPSSDSALKVLNNDKLETLESDFKGLNKKAKSGELTLSEYKKQLEELKIDAEKYGATKEMLEYITKEAVPDKTITKALEKKSKKK